MPPGMSPFAFVYKAVRKIPNHLSGRLVIGTIMTAAFVLTSGYSGYITSVLALPHRLDKMKQTVYYLNSTNNRNILTMWTI